MLASPSPEKHSPPLFSHLRSFQSSQQDFHTQHTNVSQPSLDVALESNKKKLIGLNVYGQLKINELINLAKSCAIVENQKVLARDLPVSLYPPTSSFYPLEPQ